LKKELTEEEFMNQKFPMLRISKKAPNQEYHCGRRNKTTLLTLLQRVKEGENGVTI